MNVRTLLAVLEIIPFASNNIVLLLSHKSVKMTDLNTIRCYSLLQKG
jgi:hypothetical protein